MDEPVARSRVVNRSLIEVALKNLDSSYVLRLGGT
jgi:hypothetical protein